jgi:hypothetical protein
MDDRGHQPTKGKPKGCEEIRKKRKKSNKDVGKSGIRSIAQSKKDDRTARDKNPKKRRRKATAATVFDGIENRNKKIESTFSVHLLSVFWLAMPQVCQHQPVE